MAMKQRPDSPSELPSRRPLQDKDSHPSAKEQVKQPFQDQRNHTAVQRKLIAAANGSKQVSKAVQLQEMANRYVAKQSAIPVQSQPSGNTTGLPGGLKTGIEHLSGHSMDDVKVHYNSSRPAQLQAHAYAQGTDIHLGAGQEKHLPHEAWHVVQQK